jgi:hypothetical protein
VNGIERERYESITHRDQRLRPHAISCLPLICEKRDCSPGAPQVHPCGLRHQTHQVVDLDLWCHITTDSIQLGPQYAPAKEVDYPAAASLMVAWKPNFRVHLFYLGRFLNHELPPEVRWLNGYRLLEWHFRRGKVGLAKDNAYPAFLAQHGQAFDALLGPEQDRKGMIEEVRALAAHAILSRTTDPRNETASTNLIIKTFAALESLVTALLNEGAVEGVSFFPKQPEDSTKQRDQITPAISGEKS